MPWLPLDPVPFTWPRPPAGARHLLVLFWLAAALVSGCPQRPPRGDLGRLPLITSDDPRAEAELREARLLAQQGNAELARVRYETFLDTRTDDPLAPIARLELGKLHLASGETPAAREQFERVALHDDPALAERGRFYLGVAMHLAGEHAEAVTVLEPFVDRTVDPDDTALLLNALAGSLAQTGAHAKALVILDKLIEAPVPERDRSEARQLAESIATERATAAEIDQAYAELPEDGNVWPLVARRALREADAAGLTGRVREVLDDMETQGLELDESLQIIAMRAMRPEEADPQVVGAILTLSGRARKVGELALHGVMLASGLPEGPFAADAPRVVYRDDGGDPERAAQAVEDLVTMHRAIAIVGPIHGRTAEVAAQRAQELGVPLITLTPSAGISQTGDMVFRLFHTPDEEAAALVAAARARGATRFAVLQPQTPYGDVLQEAFARAVSTEGGQLVGVESYAPDATSFGEVIADLERTRFEALYVADAAGRLALIAPALAAADLWSVPEGGEPPRGGRGITLLAPSVAFDRKLPETAGRYLQGAMFAAVFDAQAAGPAAQRFAERFRSEFGAEPNAFAAFAYDAYRAIRHAVDAGALTRAALADQLLEVDDRDAVGPSPGFTAERTPRRAVHVLELEGDTFVRGGGAAVPSEATARPPQRSAVQGR